MGQQLPDWHQVGLTLARDEHEAVGMLVKKHLPARSSGSGRLHFGPRALEQFTTAYAVNIGAAQ